MDDSPIRSLFSLLEDGIKLFVALGAVLYGFGFITVAVHYSRYNVTSLSLLNTDYVVAGLLSLVPLTVLSLISLGYYHRLSHTKEGCLKRLSVVLGGLFIALLILLFFLRKNFSSWTVSLFLIVVLAVAVLSYAILKGIADDSRNARAEAFAAIIFLIPTLFVYTLLFAYYVYPQIPRAIGGGKPATVRFALKEPPVPSGGNPANAEMGQSSPPRSMDPTVLLERDGTNQRITIGYKLLLATDKTYVIQQAANDKTTYEFPKDAVSGILFSAE